MAETLLSNKRRANCDSGLQRAKLWIASLTVTFGLGYCLWQLVPEPGLLADSLFGSQAIVEEGPVILSSPNYKEPTGKLHPKKSTQLPNSEIISRQ